MKQARERIREARGRKEGKQKKKMVRRSEGGGEGEGDLAAVETGFKGILM